MAGQVHIVQVEQDLVFARRDDDTDRAFLRGELLAAQLDDALQLFHRPRWNDRRRGLSHLRSQAVGAHREPEAIGGGKGQQASLAGVVILQAR